VGLPLAPLTRLDVPHILEQLQSRINDARTRRVGRPRPLLDRAHHLVTVLRPIPQHAVDEDLHVPSVDPRPRRAPRSERPPTAAPLRAESLEERPSAPPPPVPVPFAYAEPTEKHLV